MTCCFYWQVLVEKWTHMWYSKPVQLMNKCPNAIKSTIAGLTMNRSLNTWSSSPWLISPPPSSKCSPVYFDNRITIWDWLSDAFPRLKCTSHAWLKQFDFNSHKMFRFNINQKSSVFPRVVLFWHVWIIVPLTWNQFWLIVDTSICKSRRNDPWFFFK